MSTKRAKKTKNKHQLIIGVRSETEMFKEAGAAFERLDRKERVDPINRLYFPTAAYMWSKLSPQRLEALYALRQKGAMSIRKLAAELKRDYRAVHRDVQVLLSLDLVQKGDDQLLSVPWDSILIELAQEAVA
jgi:predicted transcriptional regulator